LDGLHEDLNCDKEKPYVDVTIEPKEREEVREYYSCDRSINGNSVFKSICRRTADYMYNSIQTYKKTVVLPLIGYCKEILGWSPPAKPGHCGGSLPRSAEDCSDVLSVKSGMA